MKDLESKHNFFIENLVDYDVSPSDKNTIKKSGSSYVYIFEEKGIVIKNFID